MMSKRYANARYLAVALAMLALIVLAACAKVSRISATARPTASPRAAGVPETATPPAPPTVILASCLLPTVTAPTAQPGNPVFAQLDPATGLHVTGLPQTIDLASYRLEVSGKVDRPLLLRYDDLRCLRRVEARVKLVCQGYFEDTATWAGVPLSAVLGLAQVQPSATSLRLVGADGFANSVLLTVSDSDKNFLAYELEGQPLPVWHGFPLRAVFPGLAGNTWVKWLIQIVVE